jgi:hypothetical protein
MRDPTETAAELKARVRETPAAPSKIDALLGPLSAAERVAAVRSLGGADLRLLWRAAAGYRALRLTDLVPPQVAALAPVRHFGRNSMAAFTIFEKRFYRDNGANPAAPELLFGANFQTMSPLTGPGYFVVEQEPNSPELRVDYRRLPEHTPADWPKIRANERGISRLVYGFMVDTLRGVSEHVTIGSAARNGRDIGAFFVLCREELPPAGSS